MKFATITNRFNDKHARVKIHVSSGGLCYINKRQFDGALRKLGHGPIRCTDNLIVYNRDMFYSVLEGPIDYNAQVEIPKELT